MKTKYKMIYPALCLFLCLSFNSCLEPDDSVYTTIVADKYDYSEQDMVRLLGNAYTPWRSVVVGMINETQTISSDETLVPVRPWGWNGTTINMHLHTWTSETGEAINRWGELYTGINNANQVIYQIESGMVPVSEGKENYLAELKALRASYYYMLCDYYGNVPYLTQFNVPDGFLPEQITRKALNDSIIKEVTEALPLLPENVDKSTYGRFTQWGAYALLAKMYLNAEVYTGTPQWEKCIEACDKIISSGKFDLADSQKEIFSADNEDCVEAIFAVPFDQSYASGLNIFNYVLNGQFSQVYSTTTFGGWGGSAAIPQFIDTFDEDDSRLKDNYLQGQQTYPDGSNVMCELGYSLGKPMDIVNVVPGLDWAEEPHGLHLAKYEYVAGMNPGAMSNDVFVFRYTDVLMMKAECLLRTGHADDAAKIVTQIRERAFKSNPAKAEVTGDELMEGSCYDYGLRESSYVVDNGGESPVVLIPNPRITHEGGADIQYGRFLDELGWEFNQEGRRRQDMIRFGVWTTKSWLSHEATKDANKELYPIPRTELEKNGKLKQNPGY